MNSGEEKRTKIHHGHSPRSPYVFRCHHPPRQCCDKRKLKNQNQKQIRPPCLQLLLTYILIYLPINNAYPSHLIITHPPALISTLPPKAGWPIHHSYLLGSILDGDGKTHPFDDLQSSVITLYTTAYYHCTHARHPHLRRRQQTCRRLPESRSPLKSSQVHPNSELLPTHTENHALVMPAIGCRLQN